MKSLIFLLFVAMSACLRTAGATNAAPTAETQQQHVTSVSNNFGGRLLVARVTSECLGTSYVAEVRWEDLKTSPHWDGSQRPPMAPSTARDLASSYLSKAIELPPSEAFAAGTPRWWATGAALRQCFLLDVWFYEIRLVPFIQWSYNHPAVTVFVTMDGRVLPLRRVSGRSE